MEDTGESGVPFAKTVQQEEFSAKSNVKHHVFGELEQFRRETASPVPPKNEDTLKSEARDFYARENIAGITENYPVEVERRLSRGEARVRVKALRGISEVVTNASNAGASVAKKIEANYSKASTWFNKRVSEGYVNVSRIYSVTKNMVETRDVNPEDASTIWKSLLLFRAQEFLYASQYKKAGSSHEEYQEASHWEKVSQNLQNQFKWGKILPNVRNLGESWKGFISLYPAEKFRYIDDIPNPDINLQNPQDLSKFLYSVGNSFYDLDASINKSGESTYQPIGSVEYRFGRRAKVVPLKDGEPMVIQLQARDTNQNLITQNIRLGREESPDTFQQRVQYALDNKDKWQAPGGEDEPEDVLIAVNLEEDSNRLYSKDMIRSGFKAGKRGKPAMTIYRGTDAYGLKRVQVGMDHNPFDGELSKVLFKGGVSKKHGVQLRGANGYFQELTGEPLFQEQKVEQIKDQKEGELAEGQVRIESYHDVVVAEFKKTAEMAELAGDAINYSYLWALQVYVKQMKSMRPDIYKSLPDSTSLNFVVTKDPLEPLAAASDALGDMDSIPPNSPYYRIRHVVMMSNSLVRFKLEKDKILLYEPNSTNMPATMQSMELTDKAQYPDAVKKLTLAANEADVLTSLRANVIFPSTATYETRAKGGDTMDHTTPAGRDFPNPCINNLEDRMRINFNVDAISKFVPPAELENFVKFAVPAMRDLLQTVAEWSQNDESVFQLNDKIEKLYQESAEGLIRAEFERKYSQGQMDEPTVINFREAVRKLQKRMAA